MVIISIQEWEKTNTNGNIFAYLKGKYKKLIERVVVRYFTDSLNTQQIVIFLLL